MDFFIFPKLFFLCGSKEIFILFSYLKFKNRTFAPSLKKDTTNNQKENPAKKFYKINSRYDSIFPKLYSKLL